jgi:hypothetical protein
MSAAKAPTKTPSKVPSKTPTKAEGKDISDKYLLFFPAKGIVKTKVYNEIKKDCYERVGYKPNGQRVLLKVFDFVNGKEVQAISKRFE